MPLHSYVSRPPRALLERGAPGDDEAARRLLDRAARRSRSLGMAQLADDVAALAHRARPAV